MKALISGVVTLDGPAGVGKSTLARRLAERLGIAYLDTGAMYRTLGLRLGAAAADMDEAALRTRCRECAFSLEGGAEGKLPALFCNGVPVGEEIRTEKAGRLASLVAKLPVLREELQRAQRSLGRQSALVAEGRDMGTKVFPDARYKFFLDARPEVRAKRRYLELEARGTLNGATLEEIQAAIEARDREDRNRAVDPLRPAQDACIVDTSDLDIDGVLQALLDAVAAKREHGGGAPRRAARAQMQLPGEASFSHEEIIREAEANAQAVLKALLGDAELPELSARLSDGGVLCVEINAENSAAQALIAASAAVAACVADMPGFEAGSIGLSLEHCQAPGE